MKAIMKSEKIKTITTHYIDGAFVESHGPRGHGRHQADQRATDRPRHAGRRGRYAGALLPAAKRAFASFGRTTKDERSRYLRQLHVAVSARIDDLTAVMIEEYWRRSPGSHGLLWSRASTPSQRPRAHFKELPLRKSWGKTTVTLVPVGVAGLITAWNANALFICLSWHRPWALVVRSSSSRAK